MAMIGAESKLLATVVAACGVMAGLAVIARQPEIGPDEVREPIAGIVRDPQGRPVPDALVVAGILPWEYGLPIMGRRIVKTGPDGRFRATLVGHEAIVPRSRLIGCVFKEPFSPICFIKDLAPPPARRPPDADQDRERELVKVEIKRFVKDKPTPPAGDVELALEASAPFVGVVKDQGGRPIEGASVRIEGLGREAPDGTVVEPILPPAELVRGTPLESLYLARSDKGGKFRFPALPPGSRLLLLVEAKGMADRRTRPISGDPDDPLEGYLAGTEADPAEIELGPEARVAGRVVTALPGVKTSGLKVWAQEINGGPREVYRNSARTDAEGRFVLIGLDATTVNIFLVDHPPAGEWTYRAVQDLELTPGMTKDVEIELIRGVLAEGTVVDQAGRSIAGAKVGLQGPSQPRSGAAVIIAATDADGRYRFRLPPGDTDFYIFDLPQGYSRLPSDGSSQHVEVPGGAATFRVPPIPVRSVAEE
jgi:hypothetical protein